MTLKSNHISLDEITQLLLGQDEGRLREALELLLNVTMQLERCAHLQAEPYERSPERTGHANGFKDKSFKTRLGELSLRVPQTRGGEPFYPQSLEKGLRSERALKLALAEMYVQGVSTRKVARITEQLCGFEVTSQQVSRAAQELDVVLESWRQRPLGQTPYVQLDARYEKVRRGGVVSDAAVLVAVGINSQNKRSVLGVSVSLSEHEAHWREFLNGLLTRGLCGVRLVTSDAHAGLKSALRATLGGVSWQRCQFHLQQNAQGYVPKVEMRYEVASDIRSVFNSASREDAESRLKALVDKYAKSAPKLSAWMEQNLSEGLTVFALPEPHRRLLRTTNGMERLNKEIKRRTRVAGLFGSEESCLRLVSAVLMEISEEWESGRTYLAVT